MLPKAPNLVSSITKDNGKKVGKYILMKKLGEGQFGVVWKGMDTEDKKIYAIKQIKRSKIDRVAKLKQLLSTEVAIMHKIDHPNILHLYDFFTTANNYYLVVKFCNQGNFNDYMKEKGQNGFAEKDALYFLQQIMNGFFELRKEKVLHRDFKLDNIFMHEERVVIGDFGFAKSGDEITTTKLGTPLTQAPELLFNDTGVIYNSKADLWSIGVVFYQILFGKPPYIGNSIPQLKADLLLRTEKGLEFPADKPVSEEAKDLLRRLLIIDPIKRIEWADFFNHPLFVRNREASPTDIKKVFGEQGVRESTLMKKRFIENQLIANQQAKGPEANNPQAFYNEKQLTDIKPTLSPKTVNEDNVNSSEEETLLEQSIVTQIFFRYCHELNKVFFFIYAAKKMQALLKGGLFPTANAIIMNLSLLVLKKGTMLNNVFCTVIPARTNIFSIPSLYFQSFLASDYYKEILQYVESNRDSMAKHIFLMLDRAKANKLVVECEDLVSSKTVKSEPIDAAIAQQFIKLKALSLIQVVRGDEQLKRNYFVLLVLLNYTYHSQKLFPFLTNNPNLPKYNWNGFYYMLERSSCADLEKYI